MEFRKYILSVIVLVTAVNPQSIAQTKKIAKISYTSSPVSQYLMREDRMRSTPTKASLHDFMNGITDYYSLYVNMNNRSSIYLLDSSVQVRPIGWENPKVTAALADSVLFTVKSSDNKTFKHEWIMNQTFYSEGQVGDVKWELTNETKNIDGLKCLKAFSKNYPMLTVWYTKDLPLSNGPGIYQGLPGLVVWAEDYFRTVQLTKISYTDDEETFDKLYGTKIKEFTTQKNKKTNYDKEPLVLVKKGDLALGYYEYFYKKPYKRP